MTKLTRDHARLQASRLLSSPMLAPQSQEGMREIVDCLMRHCQSAEHCEATMTRFLDSALHVQNVTAELAMLATELEQPDQPPAGCDRCYLGPDVSTGEIRWAAHVPGERNGYTYAVRCDCARGKWLAKRDQERAVQMASKEQPRQRKAKHEHPADADWARRAAGDQA